MAKWTQVHTECTAVKDIVYIYNTEISICYWIIVNGSFQLCALFLMQ